MKIEFSGQFLKDLKKLRDQKTKDAVAEIIRSAEAAISMSELQQVKKLKGTDDAYRIKIGDYRLGFFVEGDVVVLERFLHRKDIYRYFPKK